MLTALNCPKCQNPMVIAQATTHGDEYLYCRTCKKELKEIEGLAALDTTSTDLLQSFEDLIVNGNTAAPYPPPAQPIGPLISPPTSSPRLYFGHEVLWVPPGLMPGRYSVRECDKVITNCGVCWDAKHGIMFTHTQIKKVFGLI